MEFNLSPMAVSSTYSEGERQLPIGLAGRVQVDVLPLPALVIRTLALREERRDTNRGVRERREGDRVGFFCFVFLHRVGQSSVKLGLL